MIKDGEGSAGLGVFVNGTGYTHTIMRCCVKKKGERGMAEVLIGECGKALATFFPEVKGEKSVSRIGKHRGSHSAIDEGFGGGDGDGKSSRHAHDEGRSISKIGAGSISTHCSTY
jgi:hypothetical protein